MGSPASVAEASRYGPLQIPALAEHRLAQSLAFVNETTPIRNPPNSSFSQCSGSAILAIMDDSQVREIIHVDMGRVLCVGRTARRPETLKGSGRWPSATPPSAASRRRGELRGAPLRRDGLRHAVGHRDAQVFGTRVRPAPIRGLSRRLPPDSDNLHRLHAAGRTAFSRRSLSRRHRQLSRRHPNGELGRPPRRSGRILEETGLTASAGSLLQQIPGKARL